MMRNCKTYLLISILISLSLTGFNSVQADGFQKVTKTPVKEYNLSLEGTIIRKAGQYYLQLRHQDILLPESATNHPGVSYENYFNKYVILKGSGHEVGSMKNGRSALKESRDQKMYKITDVKSISVTESPAEKKYNKAKEENEKRKEKAEQEAAKKEEQAQKEEAKKIENKENAPNEKPEDKKEENK